MSHHFIITHAYRRVYYDERGECLVGYDTLATGGVTQFFTVGSQSFVVTGDDDKGLVVLWECFQVLHEFSYRLVRIACSGHIVIHFLWNGRREMNLFQFFRQFEGSMAGVGHQLHVNILPLLPDFPLLYFLAALRQEGAVSGTFVRAKGFCQFKVMISNDGVGPETVGYDALVPGRYFINGQEVVARVLLLMHGFLQGSVGVVRILAAVCAAVDRQHTGAKQQLCINGTSSFHLRQYVGSV